ncbi:ABC transporter permease [Oscillatoria sp. CS-180]|uniref:ABC transporter permease n=1 Tax=Oscillatoria sp. CS-180 TaxID=3021720 RepID=UPI00232C980C|nr:ABC transporter permease [Oscillatoria sp. CS-180]MDB9527023.1 ABC transporter permease [Oscillatoria sp. CS-180]
MTNVLRPLVSFLKGTTRPWIRRLKRLIPLSNSQWANLSLLKTLVQRDMEAKYKGSILGNLWPLLNQLSQLLIYTYIFSIVLKVKLSLRGMPEENTLVFGLWLFAGLIPWLAFSTGVMGAAGTVVSQTNLVKKVVFPLTLLPLVPTISAFMDSTFGIVLLITFVAFLKGTISASLWLLPVVWVPQFLLTAGIGFLTAALTVFIRDTPQTLGVVLNLWFYATPIIYPASMVPPGFEWWVFWVNPLTAISELYRDIILVGEITHWTEWGIATGISAAIFLIGYGCYQKLRPAFADVL